MSKRYELAQDYRSPGQMICKGVTDTVEGWTKIFPFMWGKDFENYSHWFKPIEDKEPTAFQSEDDLKSKLYQALGEVSMCWDERPKGVFDSTNAKRIGDELWAIIKPYIRLSQSIKAGTGTANETINEEPSPTAYRGISLTRAEEEAYKLLFDNLTSSLQKPTANETINEEREKRLAYLGEEKKDWEIVALKNFAGGIFKKNNGKWRHVAGGQDVTASFTDEQIIKENGKTLFIHSVRRLIDNEVFSVGDVFSDNTAGFYTEQKIKSFEIYGEDMKLIMNDKGAFYRLGSVKKVPSKPTANDVSKEEPMVFKCMLCGDKKYVGNPVLDRQFKSIDDYIKVEKEKADRQDKKERIRVWLSNMPQRLSYPYETYEISIKPKGYIISHEKYNAIQDAIEQVLNATKEPERWDLMWSEGKVVLIKSPTGKWLLREYPDNNEKKTAMNYPTAEQLLKDPKGELDRYAMKIAIEFSGKIWTINHSFDGDNYEIDGGQDIEAGVYSPERLFKILMGR